MPGTVPRSQQGTNEIGDPCNLLLAQLCAKGLSSSDPRGIGIGGFHLWGESARREYGRDVIQGGGAGLSAGAPNKEKQVFSSWFGYWGTSSH